jgi:hypothetical protein
MKLVSVTVKIPQLLLFRLNSQAEREHTDISTLVCRAAETHLGHVEPVPPEVRAVERELPAIAKKVAKAKRERRRKRKGK